MPLVAGQAYGSGVRPEWFGAVGDAATLEGLSITSGAAALTAAASSFTAADVGKTVWVYGAGAGGEMLVTTVAAYVSATAVTLAANAQTTVAAAAGVIGTECSEAIQSAIDSVPTTRPGTLELLAGARYLVSPYVSPQIERSNFSVLGNGAEVWGDTHADNYSPPGTGSAWTHGLFRVGAVGSSGILHKNFLFREIVFRNVAQTGAQTDTGAENGYYTELNGTPVTYNRRQNKRLNMAGAIEIYQAGNIDIVGCQFYECGRAFGTSSPSGKVNFRGNHVEGWGSVACQSPGDGSVIENNDLIQTAPIIDETDRAGNLGTSHAVYVSSGAKQCRVLGNRVVNPRVAFFQINTSSATACQGHIVADNYVEGAYYAGYVGGDNAEHEVQFRGNTFKDCGAIVCEAPQGIVGVHGNTWDGSHSINVGPAVSASRAARITIDGNTFRRRSGANESALQVVWLDDAATLGKVSFTRNRVEDCALGVYIPFARSDAATAVDISHNTFVDSACQFGFSGGTNWDTVVTSPLITCSQNEFILRTASKYGIYTYVGALIDRNTFVVSYIGAANIYPIWVDTLYGSAKAFVTDNLFHSLSPAGEANGTSVTLSGVATDEVLLSGNRYTNGITFGGGGVFEYTGTLADDGTLALPATTSGGFGTAQAGDGEEYAFFSFTSAGVVTIISGSANAVATDTDTKFCVYDGGSNVVVKNRLGASKRVAVHVRG